MFVVWNIIVAKKNAQDFHHILFLFFKKIKSSSVIIVDLYDDYCNLSTPASEKTENTNICVCASGFITELLNIQLSVREAHVEWGPPKLKSMRTYKNSISFVDTFLKHSFDMFRMQ